MESREKRLLILEIQSCLGLAVLTQLYSAGGRSSTSRVTRLFETRRLFLILTMRGKGLVKSIYKSCT